MRTCLYYKSKNSKHISSISVRRGNRINSLGLRRINPKNKPNRIILKVTIAGVQTPCPGRPKNVKLLWDRHIKMEPMTTNINGSLNKEDTA